MTSPDELYKIKAYKIHAVTGNRVPCKPGDRMAITFEVVHPCGIVPVSTVHDAIRIEQALMGAYLTGLAIGMEREDD